MPPSRAPPGAAAPLRHFFFCHPCASRIQCRCLCLSSFCHPRRLSPRLSPTLRTRGSSVVLFAKTGRSKDPGSPIESGMTRNANAKSRAPAGAAAPQSRTLWRRGLFERSACPEQREGTLNQKPSAWESRFLPSTDSGQARDPSLRSGQARNDNGAAPEGPRLGAHGFGSFCRNKRISPCGGETPQSSLHSVPPLRSRQARRLE